MIAAAPAARLVSAFVPGPAGRLEALVRLPPEPWGAAVVAHPHPLHGGTMHTKVVHRTARLLADRFHLVALRFNFRGVGASEGTHDAGPGETEDVLAAVEYARREQPAGPLVLSGFSFGSICALRAAPRARPDLLFVIGVPIDIIVRDSPRAAYRELSWSELERGIDCPVVWVQGEHDQFADAARAHAIAERNGWAHLIVPGADHFFADRLGEFERQAEAALRRVLPC